MAKAVKTFFDSGIGRAILSALVAAITFAASSWLRGHDEWVTMRHRMDINEARDNAQDQRDAELARLLSDLAKSVAYLQGRDGVRSSVAGK